MTKCFHFHCFLSLQDAIQSPRQFANASRELILKYLSVQARFSAFLCDRWMSRCFDNVSSCRLLLWSQSVGAEGFRAGRERKLSRGVGKDPPGLSLKASSVTPGT